MSISLQPTGMVQAAGSGKLVMSTYTKDPDALGNKVLSVALIGAEERRRNAVAKALAGAQASVTREFSSYPELDDVPRLLDADYDVIIVELDSNPEHALDLVENICGSSSVTVMVYSAQTDSEMLVRCMRAGAREFLSKLLSKHSSGLFVLAAPDKYTEVEASNEAVQKLLTVARQNFDYVVIDAGSRFGATGKTLFEGSSTVYLVMQVGIAELRNSNRLISESLKARGAKLEIVLNRATLRSLGIDEESITKALTVPVQWKIPNDYPAARRAQNTATPLALNDSPISRVIWQMTRTACGLPPSPQQKTPFTLFT